MLSGQLLFIQIVFWVTNFHVSFTHGFTIIPNTWSLLPTRRTAAFVSSMKSQQCQRNVAEKTSNEQHIELMERYCNNNNDMDNGNNSNERDALSSTRRKFLTHNVGRPVLLMTTASYMVTTTAADAAVMTEDTRMNANTKPMSSSSFVNNETNNGVSIESNVKTDDPFAVFSEQINAGQFSSSSFPTSNNDNNISPTTTVEAPRNQVTDIERALLEQKKKQQIDPRTHG